MAVGDGEVALEAVDDAPGVGGDAVADEGGDAVDGTEAGLQAVRVFVVEKDAGELFLGPGQGFVRLTAGGVGGGAEKRLIEDGEFGAGVEVLVGEAEGDAAGKADQAFGALHVAAEPVEVVGDARGQIAAGRG